jgi:hypothetical protein
MAGATAEEMLALKPPGWLVRPLPAGRPGFRMISPGKMSGSYGTVSFHRGGSPGVLRFSARPEPWLFVLNSAAEHLMLVEILAGWASPAASPGAAVSDIPRLAGAAQRLVRDRLVQVYLDPLDSSELVAVHGEQAEDAVADPQNWWRDDDDASAEPATQVFALSFTEKGATTLASFACPRPASRSRLKHHH